MSLTIHRYPSYIRRRFRVLVGAVSMILTLLLSGGQALAVYVDEPVFDTPRYAQERTSALPVFRGFTGTDTVVDIRIDGAPAGRADVSTDSQGKTKFTFTPSAPLSPGYHAVEAFASDSAGTKTARQSLWWLFHVADLLPAPVLYNVRAEGGRIVVSGVVKSGARVRVYLDGRAVYTSDVFLHASGARGFTVRLPQQAPGTYALLVTAVSETGQESSRSNEMTVRVTAPTASPSRRPTPSQLPKTAPAPGPEKVSEEPRKEKGAVAGEEGQVVILPRSEPAQDATMTPTTTVPESPAEELPLAETPGTPGQARLPLLIVLGILLVALIVWYATRKQEEAKSMDYLTPPPPPTGSAAGSELARPASSPPAPSPSPTPQPSPPPPAPNFASRDEY